MRHVIIGAGPAGVIAAEHIRDLDPDAQIVIVGDEQEPPYSRMALPYLLSERIGEQGTWLRKSAAHYDGKRIDCRQDRVLSVDAKNRELALAGGGSLAYDSLLVATGSSPVIPPLPGMDLPGVYPCWTLADARNILALAQPGKRVVLMGAGFIGCIILEALAQHKVELTVVEMAERMVPRMMNQVSGGLIKKWCENQGVTVHTSTRVESVEQADAGLLDVALDNGEHVMADLLVCATGVLPNLGLLEDSGIETDTGILVNERLQSSDPNVYAAGDVCQGRDFSTGEYSVHAIQPTAADHARIAAMNMCGRTCAYQGSVNMNVLDTMGLVSSSYGLWMGTEGGDSVELCDAQRFRYLNLQFEEDVLVGSQALGLTQHVGVLRGLIQSKLHLGEWKARLQADPTRIMEAYLGSTQAVGHNAGLM